MSFYAVLFPRDVLDEILNLIESVSEGFPTYSSFKSRNYIQNEKHGPYSGPSFVSDTIYTWNKQIHSCVIAIFKQLIYSTA